MRFARDPRPAARLLDSARALRVALLALLACALAAVPAAAQGFGKNKVHYESLQWRVFETPHLRLHYYAQEESLARRVVAVAESACVEYDARFRMKLRKPIPFLLYSAHHLFQQTNATPSFIGEGTGGLTELIKGRVLLPHNGSWARLKWVTRHELVHAYMLEKFAQVQRAHRRPQSWLPDLWFIEGLAEYASTTWDADAEGLLRDMVCSRMAYPLTQSAPITGSVEMYKEGQAFLLWLAEKHGEARIFDLIENAWRAEDFATAFRITYGEKLEDVDRQWFESLRKRYWPMVAVTTRPHEVGRRLTASSRFNLGPRALPARSPGDSAVRFVYFAVREGSVDLVLNEPVPPKRGAPAAPDTASYGQAEGMYDPPSRNAGEARPRRRERRLLRGGSSVRFESFHLFQNRPGVSRSGKLAVSSKSGGRDAITVLDAVRGKVERRLDFPNLVAIHDPVLDAAGESVVFSAQDYGGRSDLWRASWPGGVVRLERLTNDDFDDDSPDLTPDGAWVVFASDRADQGGRSRIFRMALADGRIEQMSFGDRGDDQQPAVSPDGRWIVFRSTRGGTSDLYVRPAEPAREARRLTRMLGPVTDPSWTADGGAVLCTVQDRVTFHTWQIKVRPDSLEAEPETPAPLLAAIPPVVHAEEPAPYQRRLSLDLLQNGVIVDPGSGAGGAGQIAFSDVLGNEQLYLTIANDSERFGDFWDGWQGGLTYYNQGQRLNYGLGVFRLTELYDPDFDLVRREKRIGTVALATYPFSRFDRLESSVVFRHATDHLLRSGEARTTDLLSHYVGVVHDNARWSLNGPMAGTRLNLTAGYTRDLTAGESDYASLFAEMRHYRQPLPGVVLAARGHVASNLGPDAGRNFVGGPGRLRGYERRALAAETVANAQVEVRAPVLRNLVLAIPALWEFPTVSAAAFADGAWGWEQGSQVQLGGAGFGVYVLGGYLPALRWNWVWRSADLKRFEKKPVRQFALTFNF